MEGIAAGDERALSQLYDSTSRVVYGIALRVARESSAAEDITMDVYMQVWRTAGTYMAGRGTVLSWLAMLARSRALDWARTRHAKAAQKSQSLDDVFGLSDAAPSPESASIEASRSRKIQESLAALPADQRQAVEMAFFFGMSHTEIAERLDLPLGTVKSRIRIAMTRLRESLETHRGSIQ